MRIKHLLSLFSFLFLFQSTKAQQMKPADPALRERLVKYVADNHLQPGKMYMYWDSVSKKPYRFTPSNFLVEDVLNPVQQVAAPSAKGTINGLGGLSNFHLIKDLNNFTDAIAYPNNADFRNTSFVTLNGVAYFVADDGVHGLELWRSDGKAAGTYLVSDVIAGATSSYPHNLAVSNNHIYFTIGNYTTSLYGYDLWKTDGTAAGTVLVKNFPTSAGFSGTPVNLCDVNGVLYFAISNKGYINQLWKSDGTTPGTMLVTDYATSGGLFLRNFVPLDGVLYLVVGDATHGSELWRNDGTATGSYMLKDIDPNTQYYYGGPKHITAYNHKLYFSESDDNSSDQKLWISDGTTAGTYVVNTSNNQIVIPESADFFNTFLNQPFTINNGILYFSARQYVYFNNSDYGRVEGLYSYNTADAFASITQVKQVAFFPSNNYKSIIIDEDNIVAVNNSIYFGYSDTVYTYLYKTNGTDATTVLLKRFNNYYGISYMANGNGRLYFSAATDSSYYGEPWTSDGTEAGTVLLKDIYPGKVGSLSRYYTAVNSAVLFAAYDDVHGNELWQSNGTTTQLLKDINTTTTSGSAYSSFNTITTPPFKDGVITRLETFDKGSEPYTVTTGSEALIKDVFAGEPSSFPYNMVVKNNLTYFTADIPDDNIDTIGITGTTNDIVVNYAVFKTDGTKEGTVQITPNSHAQITGLSVTDNGTVFYVIQKGIRDELWKTDGTLAGNKLIYPFHNSFFISSDYDINTFTSKTFTQIGNTVYFSAYDTDPFTGTELWKSDGTTAGTMMVKDIYPGTGNSSPSHITAFNNQLFFSAYDGTETALWKSDGTEAGTVKLKSVEPNSFATSGNAFFFSGSDAANGNELWKTDGTAAGTQLVKDISTGTSSSSPQRLTDVNGTLFFQASDSASNIQLWKSDGTTAGTTLVKTIASSDGIYITQFTSAANQLYFLADTKLWLSNGTDAGTGPVSDDVLNDLSVNGIAVNGNKLFLSAYNYKYGYELYAGDATLAVLPVTLTSFNASLKGSDVITQWQTASEVNTSYFNLQRSTDGVHFTTVGKVNAKGTGSYSFPDINIANLASVKTIYYRLQIVDEDGSSSISKIVPVDLNLKDAVVLLLPNPVKDILQIRINNYNGKATVGVFDGNGKTVYTTQKTVQSGNDITINASTLQSGVYMVKVNLNGNMIQQKFVKE